MEMLNKINKVRNILNLFDTLDMMKIYSLFEKNEREEIVQLGQLCRKYSHQLPCPILLWYYLSSDDKAVLCAYIYPKFGKLYKISHTNDISHIVRHIHKKGVPKTNPKLHHGENYHSYLKRIDDSDLFSCILNFENSI